MRDLFDLAFDRCRHELFQGSLSSGLEEDDKDDFYAQTFDKDDLLEGDTSSPPKQRRQQDLLSSPPSSSSSSSSSSSANTAAAVAAIQSHNSRFHDFDPTTAKSLHENLRSEARNRLQMIRVSRERYSKLASNVRDSCNLVIRRVEDRRNHVEDNCRLHGQVVLRRLKQQKEGAERRLRELLYEIIGEYGKSEMRVNRRHTYLKYASRVNMMWSLWRLRWQRYVSRLCLEITPYEVSDKDKSYYHCKGKLLCPRLHLDEIRAIGDMLQSALSETSIKVSAVVRFERKSRNIEQLPNNGLQVVSSVKEYKQLLVAMKSWLSPSNIPRPSISRDGSQRSSSSPKPTPVKSTSSKQQPASTNKDEGVKTSFITCRPIEWVIPASFYPKFWDSVFVRGDTSSVMPNPVNTDTHTEGLDEFMTRFMSQHTSTIACDRVFYCLQERNLALKGPSSFPADKNSASLALLGNLEAIYVYNKDVRNVSQALFNLRSDIEHPQALHQSCSIHRVCTSSSLVGNQAEAMNVYPDVVQTESSKGSLYHFAPALQINLAETRAFSECGFTSDQIRDMSAATCPHPHLAYLASSQFAPLETLYVMVRVSPGARNQPTPADGPFYMIPLTSACVRELIKTHLLSSFSAILQPRSASEHAQGDRHSDPEQEANDSEAILNKTLHFLENLSEPLIIHSDFSFCLGAQPTKDQIIAWSNPDK